MDYLLVASVIFSISSLIAVIAVIYKLRDIFKGIDAALAKRKLKEEKKRNNPPVKYFLNNEYGGKYRIATKLHLNKYMYKVGICPENSNHVIFITDTEFETLFYKDPTVNYYTVKRTSNYFYISSIMQGTEPKLFLKETMEVDGEEVEVKTIVISLNLFTRIFTEEHRETNNKHTSSDTNADKDDKVLSLFNKE